MDSSIKRDLATYKNSNEYRAEMLEEYKSEIEPLFKYMNWLMNKVGDAGTSVSSTYSDNGVSETSIAFPVYDSNLLAFVKEAQKTSLMNRNYVYVYNRYRISTVEDELKAIGDVTSRNLEVLGAILSKYVLGGQTKSTVWPEGVRNGVFLAILKKYKEIFAAG